MDVHTSARAREPRSLGWSPPPGGDWGGEAGRRRRRCWQLDPSRDRIVSFVGKLIVSKGLDLLFAAWPLVVAACRRRAS